MSVAVAVYGTHATVVARLENEPDLVTVVRVCADGPELLATIAAGLAKYAVFAGDLTAVDSGLVDSFHSAGGLALVMTNDSGEEHRLAGLGLESVSEDASAEAVAEALARASDRRSSSDSTGAGRSTARRGRRRAQTDEPHLKGRSDSPVAGRDKDIVSHTHTPGDLTFSATENVMPHDADTQFTEEPGTGSQSRAVRSRSGSAKHSGGCTPGQVVVVWSDAGAPGRSFLAIEVAAEASLLGLSVSLVDADTRAASLAARLGMLGETAGVVRLCRMVEAGTFSAQTDSEAHARIRIGAAALRVTTGLPRPSRWQEVSKAALQRGLQALTQTSELVVVDVAAPAEIDHGLAFDTFAPQRDDATLAALEVADHVVVVGTADAVGLPRLIRAVSEAPNLTDGMVHVVANQVKNGAERGIRRAWGRFGPKAHTPSAYIPFDPQSVEHALEAATTLGHDSPRSNTRQAIREFVHRLLGVELSQGAPAGPASKTRSRR